MIRIILVIVGMFFSLTAYADMSDANKSKAWDCSGIYMANYFLPSGETFEYSMKEKSIASVKVLKSYALETGVPEKEWDDGVNKAVDKYYGSKYDKIKTSSLQTRALAGVANSKFIFVPVIKIRKTYSGILKILFPI